MGWGAWPYEVLVNGKAEKVETGIVKEVTTQYPNVKELREYFGPVKSCMQNGVGPYLPAKRDLFVPAKST